MDSTAHTVRMRAGIGFVAVFAAACLTFGSVAQASATTFDPEAVISNANMRDYDCMTEDEIQAFLDTQPGVLKSLVTSDYDKVITLSTKKSNVNTTPDKGETPKRAARIIWEACQAWKISPKVMLTMLEKEQSLITDPPEPGSTTLARAIGAGCPGSLVFPKTNPVATNRYPGFGNQMWHGARLLGGYGERINGSTIALFTPGIRNLIYKPEVSGTWTLTKRTWNSTKGKHEYEYHLHTGNATYFKTRLWEKVKVDGVYVYKYVSRYYLATANLATFKLYTYNPSVPGNANFWKIYRKYFGSTYSDPRLRRVFRFKNRSNGTYYYTTSVTQRYHLAANHTKSWAYGGVTFSMDTSVPATATKPVYRFYNKVTHKFSYIRYGAKYRARRTASGRKTWKFDGIAFRVSTKTGTDSVPLYRLRNRSTGAYLLTSSTRTVAALRKTASLRRTWESQGIVYYLPRVTPR